jgi:hypothetical protein
MIGFYEGSLHDINHFLKVYAYAETIGRLEGLDASVQETLELAAVVHDIACPLCRAKYGNAAGRLQEAEGCPLAVRFLTELGCAQPVVERVSYLVAHHHTYTDVDGPDYRILLEADFLVNADESSMSAAAIQKAKEAFFRTASGLRLLRAVYNI